MIYAPTPPLAPEHLADLRKSGLTDETIQRARLHSISDREEQARVLSWERPADLGSCLAIPYASLAGEFNGFKRLRPSRPRVRKDKATGKSKPIKYEQPLGHGSRAYFTPGFIDDYLFGVNDAIAIVEGEKKSLAVDQAGIPAIGLSGVWNAFVGRKKGDKPSGDDTEPDDNPNDFEKVDDRKLIPDLAAIEWRGLIVLVIFDFDPLRNFSVNCARAELARILSDHGAKVIVVDLPGGPIGDDGLPGKVGADDFIVAHGEEAFRQIVRDALAPPAAEISLAEYREQMVIDRVDSIGKPGVYLDTSKPGAGKSSACIKAAEKADKSLTITPSHANCRECEKAMIAAGLDAAAYPPLNKTTCQNYDEAALAISSGLSASGAVCPTCQFKDACDFIEARKLAESMPHSICTHQRAAMSLHDLAKGKRYISIAEDPAAVLRPTLQVSIVKLLETAIKIFERARQDAMPRGDFEDSQRAPFFWAMEEVARVLIDALESADRTSKLQLPMPIPAPEGIDRHLFNAMKAEKTWPDGDVVKICRAAAAGEMSQIVVRVDTVIVGRETEAPRRAILAVWETRLPPNAAVWIGDATATPADIERLAGRPVANRTPEGRLPCLHQVLQIPLDVKKSSSPKTVIQTMRAVLHRFPQFNRIGVICDREHISTITGTARKGPVLEESLRRRIAKVSHFRAGESRGSNEWLDECDLILVFGSPRVPPEAIRNYLIRTGQTAAAARTQKEAEWGTDFWSAETLSGRRKTIRTKNYRDHFWFDAHRAVVKAELWQAAGRARAVCEHGLPAIVVSNEQLGYRILDETPQPLGDHDLEVLYAARLLLLGGDGEIQDESYRKCFLQAQEAGATEAFSTKYYVGTASVSSVDIASQVGRTDRAIRMSLASLASVGLVQKNGERGGWLISQPDPCTSEFPAAPPSGRPTPQRPASREIDAPDESRDTSPGDRPLARKFGSRAEAVAAEPVAANK